MARAEADLAPDLIAFHELVNELPGEDPAKLDAKIKRKVRRSHNQEYAQSRVDELRALHRSLQAEIGKFQHSKYSRAPPTSALAAPSDFDHDELHRDYSSAYPDIDSHDLGRMIGFAVYAYYLR
jgi:hypothetical protein